MKLGWPTKIRNFCLFNNAPVVSEKLQHQLSILYENLSCFNQVVIEQTVVENNYLTGNIVEVDNCLTVEEQIVQAIKKINGESEKKK